MEIEDKQQGKKEAGFILEYLRRTYNRFRIMSNIKRDTDYAATIERIKSGIDFKGTNVWVLVFAFIIASVGLNINSPTVIIGAMLISPLMGPIIGVGLAVGINDNKLLRHSLSNLFIMAIISLIASSLYFFISPLGEPQSELLASTKPTIYDVFVAIFGGLAATIALSRKEEKFAIISGAAIATALMPPLCTVGYGIGTGQMKFFIGALYLFFINAFFIALATFIVVRILKFPKQVYLNKKKEKEVKISIYIFSFMMIVPSVIMAYNLVKESSFNANATRYLNHLQENILFNNTYIIKTDTHYSGENSSITLTIMGDTLSKGQMTNLEDRMEKFRLEKTKLIVKQMSTGSGNISTLQGFIQQNEDRLSKSEAQIESYKHEVEDYKHELEKYEKQAYPIGQLMKEGRINFPELDTLSVANVVYGSDNAKLDTIPTIFIVWKKIPERHEANKALEWIKVRLSLSNVKVYESVTGKNVE